jgi:hypothetical protein
LDRGLRTDNHLPDPLRCFETYWFHVEMLVKYFKREDLFKIIKNMDFLFHSHVDLLLSAYDSLDWGAWETKVKRCVPKNKQEHLLVYFCGADFDSYKKAVIKGFQSFHEDAKEIFGNKLLGYSDYIANSVMNYFRKEVG